MARKRNARASHRVRQASLILARFTGKNAILIILILAFAARILVIDTSYVFWDEAEYMMDGQLLKTGNTPYDTMSYRPPLIPSLLSALYPYNEYLIRLIFAGINTSSILLIYLLGRKISERTGLVASAVLAIMPIHILFSQYIMTDSIAMALSMGCVYFYLGNKKWQLYAGGVALSLSILCKFTTLSLIIVLIPIFYMRRKEWPHLLGSLGLALLIFSPYLISNYLVYHNPIYPMVNGFRIVNIPEPAPGKTAAYLVLDLLNPLLIICAIYGAILMIREKKPHRKILIFWFILMLSIFLVLVQRGVDKPPGIEWLAERFLLPAVAPFLVLTSYGLTRMRPVLAAVIVLIAMLAWYPAYSRLLIPAIELEDGLRHVTKEAGIYLQDADRPIYCRGNCPSLAYYSGKSTAILYSEEFHVASDSYLVLFDSEGPFALEKEFTRGHASARIYLISDLR
jgi:4-amino-4-deoxy-L-arabinose transferase-like glycosyltransferase